MLRRTVTTQSRGLTGALLRAFGADDYQLTVTARREITDHYLRLSFTAGGLLADHPLHPTMWIRMWFPTNGNRVHQRAYTLVDPHPTADTFDIEFALHKGAAADWARKAQPGDTIAATVLGSTFALPSPAPAGYLIVGDTASLPAVNSLLSAIGDQPAQVWLEWTHADDRELPVIDTGHRELTWVRRENNGAALVAAVTLAATPMPHHFGFVACDTKTTRAITAVLRRDYQISRKAMKAQAYWMP